jgi:hypothetical protein
VKRFEDAQRLGRRVVLELDGHRQRVEVAVAVDAIGPRRGVLVPGGTTRLRIGPLGRGPKLVELAG